MKTAAAMVVQGSGSKFKFSFVREELLFFIFCLRECGPGGGLASLQGAKIINLSFFLFNFSPCMYVCIFFPKWMGQYINHVTIDVDDHGELPLCVCTYRSLYTLSDHLIKICIK